MRAAALLVLAAAVFAVVLSLPGASPGADAPAPVRALPDLGVADLQTTLIGAAPDAAVPEIWGLRTVRGVTPPRVGGDTLAFGPERSRGQLTFERWTAATGWQIAATPQDADGNAVNGPDPNPLAERVTGHGGVLVIGTDGTAPSVIVRDPGGPFRVVPGPGPGVVDPSAGEELAGDRGAGRVAAGAFETETGDRTGAYVGILGPDRELAVARYDGEAWTREPIDVPAGPDPFRILAIAATTAGAGWLLADDGADGLDLFHREVTGGAPRWVRVDLGRRTDGIQPLAGRSETLSAAPGLVWIDGTRAGADVSVRYDGAAKAVTGVFCDTGTGCDAPLGFHFAPRYGYRSQPFADGSRIVTNVIEGAGGEPAGIGSYASLTGDTWSVLPGGGLPFRPSGAFLAPDQGFLEGPVKIGRDAPPTHLRRWPVALRAPLTAVVGEPGKPIAAPDSKALAVGADGGVERYTPGVGWQREFLLTSTGAVTAPLLRGVAWPEARRAHAVGDLGAMWLWQAETNLWERDPAAPPGFVGNLLGVAFDPADASRGFAVGREGVLFAYDKTWTQVALPVADASADFTSVAFAGREALVAGGPDLLVSDGPGVAFHPDTGAAALLAKLGATPPRLTVVAGLPDGGAVAAGRNVVIERDGPDAPWHFAAQPLVESSPVAAAAFRDGGEVRAVLSISPRIGYPIDEALPETDPSLPQPLVPPYALPGDGYLVRQTADGWRDEQRTAYNASATDRPLKTDPTLALLLGADGQGWAVGGWSGESDSAGRGSSGRGGSAKQDRSRVQTAAVQRYFDTPAGDLAPTAAAEAAPALDGSGIVRFAVAGHAQCEAPCAAYRDRSLAPDVTLSTAVSRVAALRAKPGGPRFMLYTGGRLPAGAGPTDAEESNRLGELLGSADVPVYPALAEADSEGSGPAAFLSALADFPAPFGTGAAPAGIESTSTAAAADSSARSHYAFDSAGDGGTVRVIVIDNSRGSLAASDPYQVPAEPQLPWLKAQLDAARGRGVPAVVMGSRDLNPRATPKLNVASDGDEVANVLLAGGASAYFYDRPEENRTGAVPAGAAQTLPTFGTGTLGYRSPVADADTEPDARFGDTAYLLAEVNVSGRDPATNRAPVAVRALPVIDDLSLQPVDGTLLRRSRPSLFQGIGRRPESGDRWGPIAGGTPDPPGGDPYVSFPAAPCTTAGCTTRIAPEYTFTSSDKDIGDFVRQDPASTNLRKPLIGPDDKVIPDAASGLFCPYNAGTTTVTIAAGGLSYSTQVTVQKGSVQRPCGTVPLDPSRFTNAAQNPVVAPAPAPAPAPAGDGPPPTPLVPPPPAAVPPAKVVPKAKPKPPAPRPAAPGLPPLTSLVPPTPDNTARTPTQPPPPAGGFARPIPPGGATIRVMEEKREEEAAPESSSAASAYHPDEHGPVAPYFAGLAAIAALAGASLTLGARRRDRRVDVAVAAARPTRTHRRYR